MSEEELCNPLKPSGKYIYQQLYRSQTVFVTECIYDFMFLKINGDYFPE
jgi:hypothetical protein